MLAGYAQKCTPIMANGSLASHASSSSALASASAAAISALTLRSALSASQTSSSSASSALASIAAASAAAPSAFAFACATACAASSSSVASWTKVTWYTSSAPMAPIIANGSSTSHGSSATGSSTATMGSCFMPLVAGAALQSAMVSVNCLRCGQRVGQAMVGGI